MARPSRNGSIGYARALGGLAWLLPLAACAASPERAPAGEGRGVLHPQLGLESRPDGDSPGSLATPSLEALAPEADLAQYLAYGMQSSGALRSTFERWRAALERVDQVTALPDPRLTYAEFLEEVQTRTGPQERRIGLSQSFPWPGVRAARGRVAEQDAEVLRQRVEARRLDVIEAIELAYHDYAFLGTNLRITGEVLDLLRQIEPVVQRRIQSGGKQEDLLRLQMEIGRLENDLGGLGKQRPSLSVRLAAAMNRPGGELLPMPRLVEPELEELSTARVRQQALRDSPHLAAMRQDVLRRSEEVELARYRGKPSFTIGVDYMQTGSALSPGVSGSGEDPLSLSVGMDLPIWKRSYAAAEREAEREMRGARGRASEAEFATVARLEAELFQLDDAARQVALYRDSLLPRARETLELTLGSYRSGNASLLDLIDSERSRLEFELAYWRACRDYRKSAARLRTLIGGEF